MSGRDILTRIVVPLVSAFALFVGMALVALRRPPPPGGGDGVLRTPPWPAFLRFVVVTALAGYGCFLLIVLVFNVAVAGQHGAVSSAIGGGAFLLFVVAVPVFVALDGVGRITGGSRRPDRSDRAR